MIGVLSIAVIIGRLFFGHEEPTCGQTYKDFAHIFCGYLLGLIVAHWPSKLERTAIEQRWWKGLVVGWPNAFFVRALLIVTVFEILAFFYTR
jgi:hypothetical protein